MPESSEPQQNPQEPAPRRKSKPKFEVPSDAGQPAAAGWVYREDAEGAEEPASPATLPVPGPEVVTPIVAEPIVDKPIAAEAAVAAPKRTKPAAAPGRAQEPLITNAVVFVASGLGLMTRIAMSALTLFATPVTAVRRRRPR